MPKDTNAPPDTPLATTLREQGYVPLPRLWIKGEAMPEIHQITDRYLDDVNQVRDRIQTARIADLAWQTHNQSKG